MNIPKIKRKTIYLLAIIITILGCSGCEISEPDRYYNNKPAPAEGKEYVSVNIKEGQHVNGYIDFNLDTAAYEFKILQANTYINNDLVAASRNYPFRITANTNVYSNGEYEFKIGLVTDRPRAKGIWEEPDAPDIYYITKIIIDHSIPPAPVLELNAKINEMPRLNWNKTGENIYAYIIFRKDSLSKSENAKWKVLDTLYNPDSTIYYDKNFSLPLGIISRYKIAAVNSAQFSNLSESNEVAFINGSLNMEGSCMGFLNNNEALLYKSNMFQAYSLYEEKVTHTLQLGGNVKFNNGMYAFNSDLTELYCLPYGIKEIYIIDLNTFALKKKVAVPFTALEAIEDAWIQAGKNGEAVITSRSRIAVVDLNNGNIQSYSIPEGERVASNPIISNDKSKLCYITTTEAGLRLNVLNISSGIPVLSGSKLVHGFMIAAIDLNNRIYMRVDNPEMLYSVNADNLNDEKYITIPNSVYRTFMINNEFIYVSASSDFTEYFLIYSDFPAFSSRHSWKVASYVNNVSLSPDKKQLMISLDEEQIIYIKI
jgi:hypothetical protein